MTYHDKIQLNAIIIAPADQAAEGDRLFKSHGVLDGVYAPPDRGESSPELQRVQGAGALGADGSQLCPDRQHVFHPERDL